MSKEKKIYFVANPPPEHPHCLCIYCKTIDELAVACDLLQKAKKCAAALIPILIEREADPYAGRH